MTAARHAKIDGLNPTQSRLVRSWRVEVPVAEGSKATTPVNVRLYELPYEHWGSLPRKVLKNDLHIFDDHTVSFVRNDREVEIGSSYRPLKIRKHGDFNWLRLEIDFTADADEGFGIAANKQGVRLKEYVAERIVDEITSDLANVREHIKKLQADRAALKSGSSIRPLSQLARTAAAAQESDADGSVEVPTDIAQTSSAILVGLQSILLTLARTQSRLGSQDIEGEYKRMFDTMNREWSENLATVLLAK